MTEKSFIPPRLCLCVGVTGHRGEDIDASSCVAARRAAGNVLSWLAAAAAECRGEGAYTAEAPELRLVSLLAEKADRFVAEAAVEAGYGIHGILPFPRAQYAASFKGDAATEFQAWLQRDDLKSCLELDVRVGDPGAIDAPGASGVLNASGDPDDANAYQRAGYLMLAHVDVLLAVWNGEPGKGPGGTADVVEEAQRRGMIIIWIKLDGALAVFSADRPTRAPMEEAAWTAMPPDGAAAAEVAAAVAAAVAVAAVTEERESKEDAHEHTNAYGQEDTRQDEPDKDGWAVVYKRLHELLTPPCKGEALKGLRKFQDIKVRERPIISGYLVMQGVLGWEKLKVMARYDLDEVRSRWRGAMQAAEAVGGTDYERILRERLLERWARADNAALHYSHVFRSAYVANFVLAAASVFVGLLAVLFWKYLYAKAGFISLELLLIGWILWRTWLGHKEEWRRCWLESRSLAELLRPSRLPFLVGSAPVGVGHGRWDGDPAEAWIAWYVRSSLREIPPPNGVVGNAALTAAIQVAIKEEINDQSAYHRRNVKRLNRMDHALHRIGAWSLWLTIASGGLFLALFGLKLATGIAWPVYDFKAWATIFGGALPAFGAAMFGIRAIGDYRSAARQSHRMESPLKALSKAYKQLAKAPNRPDLRRLNAHTSRIMADDVSTWSMIFNERELAAGPH